MDCKEIEDRLSGFALGELSFSEQGEVEAHLEECASCSQELSGIETALNLMGEWKPEEAPPQLLERTRMALERERSGPKSLEERYHNFVHWLVNLEVTPWRGMIATALGVCFFILLHNIGDHQIVSASQVEGCQRNLETLKRATERFIQDHDGQPPQAMERLYPDYMTAYPICPAAGFDTYSEGFGKESSAGEFVLYCSGHHHADEGLKQKEPRVSVRTVLLSD